MRRLALFLVFAATSALAQTNGYAHNDDVHPELIGGLDALQRGIDYPEGDRLSGTEGRVIVQMTVDTAGVPHRARVVRGVSVGLDSAAVSAVREARFHPLSEAMLVTLPVTFRLGEAPRRAPFRADTLLARLGGAWTTRGLPPAPLIEANAPRPGATRYVWAEPDAETERVEAIVDRDTLHVVTIVAAPGAPALADLRRLAGAIDARRVQPDSAGFYTAYDLAINGLEARADLSLDLDARTWRLRAIGCTEAGGCGTTYPVLVGGIAGLQAGISYPTEDRRRGNQGRVVVQFTVGADGVARDIVVLRSVSAGLDAASVDAVRRTRFLPGRRGGVPVETRLALPVTFRIAP